MCTWALTREWALARETTVSAMPVVNGHNGVPVDAGTMQNKKVTISALPWYIVCMFVTLSPALFECYISEPCLVLIFNTTEQRVHLRGGGGGG